MSHTIEHAIDLLRQGELVVIPTETVYGLAGDAANPDAVRRIFALKGRPASHPVIVHIYDQTQLVDWACDIPDTAYQLIDAFWPGPLTLILKKQPWVSDLVTGGQDSVGIRAPSHPLTRQLLQQFGGGLAAPSANRFGQVSPTTAQHVQAEFGENSPFIVDGGPTEVGVESTIVSLIGDIPTLLRPGGITPEQIEAVLQQPVMHRQKAGTVRAPGLLSSHYAPRTPLFIGTLDQLLCEIAAPDHTARTMILHHSPLQQPLPSGVQTLRLPADATSYARVIYASLRQADQSGVARILLEQPDNTPAWLAINDRVQRAATGFL